MAPNVTIFIDYQNVHLSGHEQWCPHGEPPHHCLVHPLKIAERIVAKRAPGGVLTSVRVYRGRPDPRLDPKSTARSDRQLFEWEQDPRVQMFRRPLRYPRDWGQPHCYEKEREKGIDVSIAIDMVRMAIAGEYEVGILFSRDTDLLPAIEYVLDVASVHTEVATWEGTSRLRVPRRQLFCHQLDEQDFRASRDTRIY